MTNWWNGPLTGFDLETTAADPSEARIVSASVAICSRDGVDVKAWLADPGVVIPDEAAVVHGITTERARAEGRPSADVVREVVEALAARPPGSPLVGFNIRYDMTVLACEAIRHMIDSTLALSGPAVDPLVLDKWLDRYRKGSRKLAAVTEHYVVDHDSAHDATDDAVAACRVAFRIASRGRVVRRARNRAEERELAELQATWESVRFDPMELHRFQMREADAERVRFSEYKRSIGEVDEAERILAERGWPIIIPIVTQAIEAVAA